MTRYLHESGLGAPPEIQFIGAGLQRPECILATASGKLFMSDRRGKALADGDGQRAASARELRYQ